MQRSGLSTSEPLELPFDIEHQLCTKLFLIRGHNLIARSTSKQTSPKNWLPGNPRARFDDHQLSNTLSAEFATPKLSGFAKYLWLIERPESAHIASLTHQIVRGRRIILTENPEMHLVWIKDRVFIKPLPKYLLSQAFWEYSYRPNTIFEDPQQATAVRQAMLGFLRSYAYLIKHKSDFELASRQEHRLVPKNLRFSALIQLLGTVNQRTTNDTVSPRWRYGELRLSRLNFWSKVLLRQMNFAKVHGQYSDYVAQYYAPLLFVFGVLSVVLNAMQVGLALEPEVEAHQYIRYIADVSEVFVPFALLLVAIAMTWFIVAIVVVIMRVVFLGLRGQFHKRLKG